MKYFQPYGLTDPEASYTNGNPATGTMGSIPPAQAIEHPQREIVNFLKDGGFTPDSNDLRQLSKSVQGGVVNYCTDQGTANFLAIVPVPPLAGYVLGQHFRIKVAYANTGPVQINISGLGWAPVVHGDKTDMGAGELFAGQVIDIAYDGSAWQMMTGGLSGSLIMMTAPKQLYCDATNGDDSLYDGTQAAVDAAHGHGPYRTLRKALNMVPKYNLSGFTFHIYLADGTYAETSLLNAPVPNGSGSIYIHGNSTTPNLVKLINAGNGSCLHVGGGNYTFDGVCFQSTQAIPSDEGDSLWVTGAGQVWLNSVGFYGAANAQMNAGPGGGGISVGGPIWIYAGANAHMQALANGTITFYPAPLPTLNVMNASRFANAFAVAFGGAQMSLAYTAKNLYGAVTGTKFLITGNAVVNTGGRGVSYPPGDVAGVQNTGGQLV